MKKTNQKNRFGVHVLSSLVGAAILLFSQLAFGQVQRTIVNPSLEQPTIALAGNVRVDEDASAGWNTSHPIVPGNCSVGVVDCRPLEYWSSGFLGVSTATGAGNQWVELNASTTSMIYQSVCLTNGESFAYSYLHRGRASNTVADVMDFRLGIPSGLPVGSRAADPYSFQIQRTSTTSNGTVTAPPTGSGIVNAPVLADNGWVRYSGIYTYAGASQMVNMGFAAVSTGGGDLSVGNFIDDWTIKLNPYIEASSVSTSAPEGTGGASFTPATGPAIRIAGTLNSPATITVQVTGGTATIGDDYSLSVPFASGNVTNTTVITVPPGVYDGTSTGSIFAIPFSTKPDNSIETDENVSFTITGVTGATLASLSACGIAPIVSTTHTILNDDLVTAAGVAFDGRALANGKGIGNVLLTLTDNMGATHYGITNPFGYFRFDSLTAGRTYVLSASHKTASFVPQALVINDNVSGFLLEGIKP